MKESPPTPTAHNPIAYKNEDFMATDDARPLRILAEYIEPMHRFARQGVSGTIVFFGSARLDPKGPLGRYYEDARTLARLVTSWSSGLSAGAGRLVVCSGGGGGIMEAANRGAADVDAKSVGLNIRLPVKALIELTNARTADICLPAAT